MMRKTFRDNIFSAEWLEGAHAHSMSGPADQVYDTLIRRAQQLEAQARELRVVAGEALRHTR